MDFYFRDSISREVLNNYLSRAVTHTSLLDTHEGKSDTFADDLRMLKNTGAKFIGRAAYVWGETNDEEHFRICRERAAVCHETDPEFVLQCCVFECVCKNFCENIVIPNWVYEAFNQPIPEENQKRRFSLEKMSFPDGRFNNHWGKDTGVPNILTLEGQMWLYYRACMYINCGCEAIHFGQVWLIGALDKDKNWETWRKLVMKVREYAKIHARRGYVICDAHCHGIITADNHSVFDFNSFPIRLKETENESCKYKCIAEENYSDSIFGKSKGGIHPSGYISDPLPFLVEFDNFGVSKTPGEFTPDLDNIYAWGYDEITWFSLQPKEYRAEFLRYISDWVNSRYPEGWVQMPSRRMTTYSWDRANGKRQRGMYRANNNSPDCPEGYGDEEIIKEIFSAHELRA